ncbi:MAG: hypothetical protein D6690_14190 [Nitrospirae bacterium]|nr:MAG: hypothetical protein D6690_14190 [Nitrospirota bacterium]
MIKCRIDSCARLGIGGHSDTACVVPGREAGYANPSVQRKKAIDRWQHNTTTDVLAIPRATAFPPRHATDLRCMTLETMQRIRSEPAVPH